MGKKKKNLQLFILVLAKFIARIRARFKAVLQTRKILPRCLADRALAEIGKIEDWLWSQPLPQLLLSEICGLVVRLDQVKDQPTCVAHL